jgi:hypothetical protein
LAELKAASRLWAPGLEAAYGRWAIGRTYTERGIFLPDWEEFLADLREARRIASVPGFVPPADGLVRG